MGNRYNFVSPGAAASQSMLEILAQRRAEERQRLLDEITKKDAESSRGFREAQIADMTHRRLSDEVEAASGSWEPGQDLSNIDPDMLGLLQRRGQLGPQERAPQPMVDVGWSIEPQGEDAQAMDDSGEQPISPEVNYEQDQTPPAPEPPSHSNFFRGTKEQVERARKQREAAQIVAQLASEPDLGKQAGILMQAAAAGIDIPANMLAALEKPKAMFAFSPVDKKTTPITRPDGTAVTTRGDNPVMELGYPPQVLPSYTYGGVDPTSGTPITHDNRTGTFLMTGPDGKQRPYTGPIGGKPTTASGRIQHVPGGLITSLNAAREDLANAERLGQDENVTAARENFSRVAGQIISLVPNPKVQPHLRAALRDPRAAGYPAEEIVRQLEGYLASPTDPSGQPKESVTLSAAEKAVIMEVISVVLNKV